MTRALTTLLTGGRFFEGPRWHTDRWWVSDFYDHAVRTVTPDGVTEDVLTVPGQPSGLGWLPDGSLLVVSMLDHRLLRRSPDGEVTEHADLSEHCGGPLNDLVVDGQGRAYVGDFGFDLFTRGDPRTTSLKRVDPDGSVHVVAEDLWFPNGTVVTPDGAALMVGETFAGRYTGFTIGADGELTDRHVWGQMSPSPAPGTRAEMLSGGVFAPDGCALDADGHIWSADALGARCARVAPGGAVVDAVPAPAGLSVFACALGGSDGRTLLLCAAPDSTSKARAAAPEAVLLTTTVDVPHAGLP